MARFPSTAAARTASLRASSSVSQCVFLASLYCLTSFARDAFANFAFPKGERPDLGRCGSSDRRRGVNSRSLIEDNPLGSGEVWAGAVLLCPMVALTDLFLLLLASDAGALAGHPLPWHPLPS